MAQLLLPLSGVFAAVLPNPSFAPPTSNIDAGTAGRVNATVTAPSRMQAAVEYNF
jgi:hypothetical protein